VADLAATLQALAEPNRRKLLQRLALGPATSGQLADILLISRPATSQHLGMLAECGLVRTTAAGRQRWHELTPAGLYELERWIRDLVETWATSPTLASPTLMTTTPTIKDAR
jgi:DNA-binding transcriptional ArsR family regulator